MKALSTLSKIGTVWLNQGLSRSWLQDCAALLGTCIAMALQPGEVRGVVGISEIAPRWPRMAARRGLPPAPGSATVCCWMFSPWRISCSLLGTEYERRKERRRRQNSFFFYVGY